MCIIVFYGISSGLTSDIEKEWLAAIIDPFGFRPAGIMGKYLTVDEKNVQAIPLTGILLTNRLLWMGIAALILFVAYFKFSFNTKKEKVKKVKELETSETVKPLSTPNFTPTSANTFSFLTLRYLIRFETRSIIKHPTFIIITIIGMFNLIASLSSFTGSYGSSQYPVTYDVIDSIRNSFYIFLIAIITFYGGVLVWKERDSKFNEIEDATPVRTGLLFLSKLIALINAVAFILLVSIVVGILAQMLHGYTHYELDVYFWSVLVIDLLSFAFMGVMALLMHYLINNRYIAYFAFITFIILNSFIWGVFEIDSNMVKFGGSPWIVYSDMNGFGPFVKPTFWFNMYWMLFCVILCFVIHAFYIRGKELNFKHRWKVAKGILGKNKLALLASIAMFVVCGGFVYYNTKVLNHYIAGDESERIQVEYETNYKKYERLKQPRIYKVNYEIDISPYERALVAKADIWARNIGTDPITELHFTMPLSIDSVVLQVGGATLKMRDNRCNYRIYSLTKPLGPNDSVNIKVTTVKLEIGFENQVSFTSLTQNGTFFNNMDICPSLGYNEGMEISDKNDRIKYKLPKKRRAPVLNEKDTVSRMNNYVIKDADWVEVETVISTSDDQIAIAPGSLIKEWKQGAKRYFRYKLDQPSLNFYSFISAKYEVERKKLNGIDLEVYYHKAHAYNVPNMIKGMEKALTYYTTNFGKYYHKQCRIIEFPRYSSFAQAFPGTMPYSEGIGFILDLRDVNDEDIDQVFYVVAHEMGHQYWAHQLCGANMQGSEWMSEGFAQYSALMVMEKEYGKDKMKKFLKYEMDGYLRGRSTEFEAERPILKTEGQAYIHYQKASVLMYYLKEMIGENKVNEALRSLLDTFAYKKPPYATSLHALRAFKRVTPDTMHYLINDMFENITLFSNRVVEASYKKEGQGYLVTINTRSEKFRSDTLGKETPLAMNDFVDVAVFGEQNNGGLGKPLVMKRLKISKSENTFTFTTKEIPYKVGIDPYNYLIDRIPDDNLKGVSELE